jgi:hypothetical protein
LEALGSAIHNLFYVVGLFEISGIAKKVKVKLQQRMQEITCLNENEKTFPKGMRCRILHGFKVVLRRTPQFTRECEKVKLYKSMF